MPKVIGISAIIGFCLSLVFLVATSFYAIALREALFECRQAHARLSNQNVQCENKTGALQADAADLAARIESEKRNARALEARLEAAGALRRCAWNSSPARQIGQL